MRLEEFLRRRIRGRNLQKTGAAEVTKGLAIVCVSEVVMKRHYIVIVDGYFCSAVEHVFPQIIRGQIRDVIAEAIDVNYSAFDRLIVEC